jgi:hypothetical protein
MTPNVGSLDKTVRIVFGLAILSLWFVLEGQMRYLALIGIVPLLTATMGFCPAYTLFGINTCSVKKK